MQVYKTKSEDARSGPIRWMDGWTNKFEDRQCKFTHKVNIHPIRWMDGWVDGWMDKKSEDARSGPIRWMDGGVTPSDFRARGPKGLSPGTERRGHSFKYIS